MAGGDEWTSNGPYGARTYGIVIHRENRSILYAAATDEGIFKTQDEGQNWVKKNGGFDHIPALDIALSPSDPDIILVAATDGILISYDGAESWRYVWKGLEDIGEYKHFVEISPHDPNYIITGGTLGLTISDDGGQNWYHSEGLWFVGSMSTAFDPADRSVIYVGTDVFLDGSEGGVYKSVDAGKSWTHASKGIVGIKTVFDIEIDAQNTNRIFAGGASSWQEGYEPHHTLYRSTDGGKNWEWVNQEMESNFIRKVAIDPNDPRVVYAATFDRGAWKSVDGGDTWQATRNGLREPKTLTVVCDEVMAIIYVGTYYGGIYKSTNGGKNWIEISQGLTGAYIKSAAINPLDPTTIYLSCYSGLYKSTNGSFSWRRLIGDVPDTTLVYNIEIDLTDTSIVYVATGGDEGHTQAFYPCGVLKSTDSGETWANKSQGLPADAHVMDIESCVCDSVHRLYVTMWGEGVYVSEDGGDNWMPRIAGLGDRNVCMLAIDPVDPNIIFVETSSGIHKTNDGGISWENKSSGLDPEGLYFKPYIDPNEHQRIYVVSCVSRFSPPTKKLYVSLDGAESWSYIEYDIPLVDYQPLCLAINPHDSDHLVLGTFFGGVWVSHDRGESWESFNSGFPNRRPHYSYD